MKKLLIALLLAALLLTGCAAKEEKPLPEAAALAQAVLDSQTYTEEMSAVSEKRLQALLGLTAEDYAQAVLIMDTSRATSEMIAVITAKDAAGADQAAARLNDYLLSLRAQYADYRPEEMPKLNAAQVQRRGLQCALAVAPDQVAARQAVDSAWGM